LKTERRRALELAFALAGIGLVLAGAALTRRHEGRALVFGLSGLVALVLALVAPSVWGAFFRAWMKLATALSWVMTRVILTLLYLLVVTPLGWVRKLAGKPTLDTAWRDGKVSYWVERDPVDATIERYAKRY
jgi:hypothetical protein